MGEKRGEELLELIYMYMPAFHDYNTSIVSHSSPSPLIIRYEERLVKEGHPLTLQHVLC